MSKTLVCLTEPDRCSFRAIGVDKEGGLVSPANSAGALSQHSGHTFIFPLTGGCPNDR
jgi:hypothetical protein